MRCMSPPLATKNVVFSFKKKVNHRVALLDYTDVTCSSTSIPQNVIALLQPSCAYYAYISNYEKVQQQKGGKVTYCGC